MKIIIATIKSWNIKNVRNMHIEGVEIFLVNEKEKVTKKYIEEIKPEYVFFIHWAQ